MISLRQLATAATILLACLVLSGPAIADNRPKVRVDGYFSMLEQLRTDLEEGTPRKLNREEWKEFDKIVGQFDSLLGGVETVDQLGRREQIRVFNLQEELDTLLVGHPDRQVICEEQRRGTGSRIPRRNCRTVEQIRDDQRRARAWVQSVPLLQNQPAGN